MELKKFFKKSRKFYLLVLLLLIFTVPVALSGCGGGGSGSGGSGSGGGSTPLSSGTDLSSFGVTGYGGTTQLTSGTVTAYELNGTTSTQIGTCPITSTSAGGCTVYFKWDGSTTSSYYAVITNANGNPDATLIGAAVPAVKYSSTFDTYITLSGDVDETTTVIAAQLLASDGGNFTNNNELSSSNSSIFGAIQSFGLTNYTSDSNYLVNETILTQREINTIYYVSDALALCIQSNSSSSSQCSALFNDAANGSGVAATNTAQAAMNLVDDIEFTSEDNQLLNLPNASNNLNSILSFVNDNAASSLPHEFTGSNQFTSYTSLNFGNFML